MKQKAATLSILLADSNPSRREAVKKWLTRALQETADLNGPLATAPSGDVAYHILEQRGAKVAVVEASLKREEDEYEAELGRALAELPNPPRLVLYAHNFSRRRVLGMDAAHFQANTALAHAFVDLRRPVAPALLMEAVSGAGGELLFLHT